MISHRTPRSTFGNGSSPALTALGLLGPNWRPVIAKADVGKTTYAGSVNIAVGPSASMSCHLRGAIQPLSGHRGMARSRSTQRRLHRRTGAILGRADNCTTNSTTPADLAYR